MPGPNKGHVAGQGCDTLGKVPVPRGWRWGQGGRCLALLHLCLLGQQAQAGGWVGAQAYQRTPGTTVRRQEGGRGWQHPPFSKRWDRGTAAGWGVGGWQQDGAAPGGKR